MPHSGPTCDTPPFEVSELSAQLELLALNTAIEATAHTEGTADADRALLLAALKRLLGEVQTAMSWYHVEAVEDEALGSELANLTQRLNEAVADFNRYADLNR